MHHTLLRTRRLRAPAQRRLRGFLLIEALVAILIFSMAALALIGLQTSMLRAQTGAKYRGDATFLVADLVGTMWADTPNLDKYAACASHAPCNEWMNRTKALLPGGTPNVTVPKARALLSDPLEVLIEIKWTVPNEEEHKFSTTAVISPNGVNP